jgi:uncharacterized protein (TIGR02246 family)
MTTTQHPATQPTEGVIMPATTLEGHYKEFVTAFNAGDADALMSLFSDDAVMIPQPGQAVSGPALRESLDWFLGLKGTMELTLRGTVEGPDTAITYGRWTLNGTGEDGEPVTLGGEGTEVVVKQADGTWRIALDDPYSCA